MTEYFCPKCRIYFDKGIGRIQQPDGSFIPKNPKPSSKACPVCGWTRTERRL